MGVSTSTWVDYVTEKLAGEMSRADVLNGTVEIMAKAYESGNVPVLPGANEALEHCAKNYRVGLASGSPRLLLDAALKGAEWHRYFERIVSSDECARGKPAPDVYLEIIRRMDLDAGMTAVVEDSVAGILAGKAANAKVVSVPGGFTPRDDDALSKADAQLDTLHELPNVLRTL